MAEKQRRSSNTLLTLGLGTLVLGLAVLLVILATHYPLRLRIGPANPWQLQFSPMGGPLFFTDAIELHQISADPGVTEYHTKIKWTIKNIHANPVEVDLPNQDYQIYFVDSIDSTGLPQALCGAAPVKILPGQSYSFEFESGLLTKKAPIEHWGHQIAVRADGQIYVLGAEAKLTYR